MAERLYRAYGKDHVHLPPPTDMEQERVKVAMDSMYCAPHTLDVSDDEGTTWEKVS